MTDENPAGDLTYYEQNTLGTWYPVVTSQEVAVTADGRLKRNGSVGPRIRRVERMTKGLCRKFRGDSGEPWTLVDVQAEMELVRNVRKSRERVARQKAAEC